MGYSINPEHVRVDFFKTGGKWYTTEEMTWTGQWKADPSQGGQPINTSFAQSLRDHLSNDGGRLDDSWAVCLSPYHETAFPLMIYVVRIWDQ